MKSSVNAFFYCSFCAGQDGHGGDREHHDHHHLWHLYLSFSLQLCDSDRPPEPSSDCQVSLFLINDICVFDAVFIEQWNDDGTDRDDVTDDDSDELFAGGKPCPSGQVGLLGSSLPDWVFQQPAQRCLCICLSLCICICMSQCRCKRLRLRLCLHLRLAESPFSFWFWKLRGTVKNMMRIAAWISLNWKLEVIWPDVHCRVHLSELEVGGYLTKWPRINALIALNDESWMSPIFRYRAALAAKKGSTTK